jgi:hypothetical protein
MFYLIRYLFVESEKNILAFEISMSNSIFVQVRDCSCNVLEQLSASRLAEFSFRHYVVKEISATV